LSKFLSFEIIFNGSSKEISESDSKSFLNVYRKHLQVVIDGKCSFYFYPFSDGTFLLPKKNRIVQVVHNLVTEIVGSKLPLSIE